MADLLQTVKQFLTKSVLNFLPLLLFFTWLISQLDPRPLTALFRLNWNNLIPTSLLAMNWQLNTFYSLCILLLLFCGMSIILELTLQIITPEVNTQAISKIGEITYSLLLSIHFSLLIFNQVSSHPLKPFTYWDTLSLTLKMALGPSILIYICLTLLLILPLISFLLKKLWIYLVNSLKSFLHRQWLLCISFLIRLFFVCLILYFINGLGSKMLL